MSLCPYSSSHVDEILLLVPSTSCHAYEPAFHASRSRVRCCGVEPAFRKSLDPAEHEKRTAMRQHEDRFLGNSYYRRKRSGRHQKGFRDSTGILLTRILNIFHSQVLFTQNKHAHLMHRAPCRMIINNFVLEYD